VFGDDALKETALQHLKHNAKRFQQVINREVRLKFTPRLIFKLDLSLEKGDEVLAILSKLDIPT
jgi:ribosome-binding factor A